MEWFEYKREVDGVHVSDESRRSLLNLLDTVPAEGCAGSAETPAAGQPAETAAKPAGKPAKKKNKVLFYVTRVAAAAACCALVIGIGGTVLNSTGILSMGSGASAEYASENASATKSSADNGISYSLAAMPETADAYDYDEAEAESGYAAGTEGSDAAQGAAEAETESRKIIYTANISIESKNYDETKAALDAAAAAAGGYAESTNEYAYNNRCLYVTYRIPAGQYEAFMQAAEGTGSVVSRSENADDVTSSYIDVQARVTALTAQRDHLLELEAQATTLSDTLEIEDKLTDVQYELENWQQQLNYYDDQVEYCTVNVDLTEVEVFSAGQQQTWLDQLWNSLTGGASGFVDFLSTLVLALAAAWPWLIILAVVIVIIVRRRRKHGQD